MSDDNASDNYPPRLQVQATLCHKIITLPLIDSSVEQNFLDSNLVSQAGKIFLSKLIHGISLPVTLACFEIERIIDPTSVKHKLHRIHPSFHVSQLKPVSSSHLCPPSKPPPPAWIIYNHPAYIVHKLQDVHHQSLQHLEDWEGYGPKLRSWVPSSCILDANIIREFHQAHPDKP